MNNKSLPMPESLNRLMGSWGHCAKKFTKKPYLFGWKSNLFGETFNLTQ